MSNRFRISPHPTPKSIRTCTQNSKHRKSEEKKKVLNPHYFLSNLPPEIGRFSHLFSFFYFSHFSLFLFFFIFFNFFLKTFFLEERYLYIFGFSLFDFDVTIFRFYDFDVTIFRFLFFFITSNRFRISPHPPPKSIRNGTQN